MSQRSFPFDSVASDRILTTARWADLTATLARDGVASGVADELQVVADSPESGSVVVSDGRMFIRGRWFEVLDGGQPVDVLGSQPADPTNPRIDRIVVRRDLAGRQVVADVIHGTPATEPDPPPLTQIDEGDYEQSLATVFVRANATTIRSSDQADGQGYIDVDERTIEPFANMRDYVDELPRMVDRRSGLLGTGAQSFDVPSWARHARLLVHGITVAPSVPALTFNNDGGANYTRSFVCHEGAGNSTFAIAAVTDFRDEQTSLRIARFGPGGGHVVAEIINLDRPQHGWVSVQGDASIGGVGTLANKVVFSGGGRWSSTARITSIQFHLAGGEWGGGGGGENSVELWLAP